MAVGFFICAGAGGTSFGKHAPKKAISKNKYLFNITI